MKAAIEEKVELPDGVTATFAEDNLTIKGPKGEVTRKLIDPFVVVAAEANTIKISCPKGTKRQKRIVNTFRAHIRNIIKGVQEPYVYKLKICSGHFPMNVALSGELLTVKNFLGEKKPRIMKVKQGAQVKINGDEITVESSDIELAGNIASDMELLTNKTNRDLRVFQDGIYIVEKAVRKSSEA